ncbi:MAG TPA: hypothetical protein VGL83_15595 [Stellaceae bacterium]
MTIDHRDKSGDVAQKYGNTLIRTLRVKYGYAFAMGESNYAKLIDVLERLDEPSLHQLIRDQDR